jgi:hypothetical protein
LGRGREQKKLEASLPKVALVQGKMLACTIAVGTGENAARREAAVPSSLP